MALRLLACVCLFLGLHAPAIEAIGQVSPHRDGRGRSIRSGNITYRIRSDGSWSRETRVGQWRLQDFSSGTRGASYDGAIARWDTFINEREGWRGSGYTPHYNASATTYRRQYYHLPSSVVAGVPSTGGPDRPVIHFRDQRTKPTRQKPWVSKGENWTVSGYGKRGYVNRGANWSVGRFD